jgi:hypothetical protein
LLRLLLDELLELRSPAAAVVRLDASAVAVVAVPASGGKVRGLPEQLRCLRGRNQVMDARRVAAALAP